MMKYTLLFPLVIGALASMPAADAALLVNESFNYGTSDLDGEPDVTGEAYGDWEDNPAATTYEADAGATWTGDSDYVASNAGGYLRANSGSNGDIRGAQLDLGQSLTNQTFWVSARILSSLTDDTSGNVSGFILAFEDGPYGQDDYKYGLGVDANGDLFSDTDDVIHTASDPDLGDAPAEGTWGLYLMQFTVNSGADDSVSLWVFDDDQSDIGDQTVVGLGLAAYSSSTIDMGDSVGDVWFGVHRAGNGTGGLDDLRISSLGGDSGLKEVLTGVAVPEPSTAVLLLGALGGLGLFLCRQAGAKPRAER